MKFRTIGRAAWAGATSVGLAFGVAACGRTNTIDYLFVTSSQSSSAGQLSVYLVDNHSGVLTEASGSPYGAGKNPIALATSPDQSFVYVLNHDDNTIVSYSINSDAGVKQVNSYTTPGSNPTSLRINTAGTFLYVTDAFQPGFSATNPGPGAVVVYPIKTDGTLGSPVTDTATGTPYFPMCNNPVDLSVLRNGNYLYVIDDPAGQPPKLGSVSASIAYTATDACTADTGQIQAFSFASSGQLTEVAGSPFSAGTTPTAIASDPTNRFVYVTDLIQNQLLAYSTESNGALSALNNGPFVTGTYPNAITVDPRGLYIYVANYNGGTVSAYAIAQNSGVPSSLSVTSSTAVTTGPTAVFIEPNGGKFLYTADFLDESNQTQSGTIFGLSLNANTGVLAPVQNTPFAAHGAPTAIAGITHGNHPTEVLPQY